MKFVSDKLPETLFMVIRPRVDQEKFIEGQLAQTNIENKKLFM